jgi:hypothetical protein
VSAAFIGDASSAASVSSATSSAGITSSAASASAVSFGSSASCWSAVSPSADFSAWGSSADMHALREIQLRINRIDGHFVHETARPFPSDPVAAFLQLPGHLTRAPRRVIRVQAVDNGLAVKLEL